MPIIFFLSLIHILLAQLREMILSGGNPLYSFKVGLGSSFIPLFAYYLASPFNLLLLLFPENLLTEGIFVITILKNTLCAVFFAACVQYIYRKRTVSLLIVSVMYALMMYALAYSWNIMWLDCVMVLPLVVMGFERLMRSGRYGLYVPVSYTHLHRRRTRSVPCQSRIGPRRSTTGCAGAEAG